MQEGSVVMGSVSSPDIGGTDVYDIDGTDVGSVGLMSGIGGSDGDTGVSGDASDIGVPNIGGIDVRDI